MTMEIRHCQINEIPLSFNINKAEDEQDYFRIGNLAQNVAENEQGLVGNVNPARKALKNEQGRSKMNELAHNVLENEQGLVKIAILLMNGDNSIKFQILINTKKLPG